MVNYIIKMTGQGGHSNLIKRAFSALARNYHLVLVPVAMDIVAFFLGLMTIGFWGESKFSFKLTLTVGVPSIGDVLDQNFMAGGFTFNTDTGFAGPALLIFVLFLIIGAFVEGGFLGLLYELAGKGESPTLKMFAGYGQRFWGRFIGLRLLMLLVMTAGMFAAVLLNIIGVLAYLVGFIVLRILYIYWEFTIVAEDNGVLDAFHNSRRHFDNRSPELSGIILTIFFANFLAGLIFNMLWTPVFIFAGIFIYGYVATGLQLALMFSLPGLDKSAA